MLSFLAEGRQWVDLSSSAEGSMTLAFSANAGRATTVDFASRGGFLIRHRSKDIKYDERGAVFLFDITTDPSSHLQIGQRVYIRRPFAPLAFPESVSDENDVWSYPASTWIAGFVEVTAKVGKLVTKSLYCALMYRLTNGAWDIDRDKNER